MLIILIISIAIMLAMFSWFLPFVNTYWNIMQYTTAYYWAMSALERWALAIRYTWPWFDWESWWDWIGNTVWKNIDWSINGFYTYWDRRNTLKWSIQSSTYTVPMTGQGNVDSVFLESGSGSENFNSLTYNVTEIIPLWVVGSNALDTGNYYIASNGSYGLSNVDIDWELRLNPFIYKKFLGSDGGSTCNAKKSLLCDWSVNPNNCPFTWDDWKDVILVSRWIRWNYSGDPITLLPKLNTVAFQEQNGAFLDSYVRRTDIFQYDNSCVNNSFKNVCRNSSQSKPYFKFSSNINPVCRQANKTWVLNMVSPSEKTIIDSGLYRFSDIIGGGDSFNLSLSLVNYLWTNGSHNDLNLYPFLEYRIVSNWWKIADRFYTVKWEWKVWRYDIKLQIQKPTLDQPTLGNFTVIF